MSRYSSSETHSDISLIIDETTNNEDHSGGGGGGRRQKNKTKKMSSKSHQQLVRKNLKFVKRPSYNSSDDDSTAISIDGDSNHSYSNSYSKRTRKLSTSSNISNFSSISEDRVTENFVGDHQTRANASADRNFSHSEKLLKIQEHISDKKHHDSKNSTKSIAVTPFSESELRKKFCSCDSDDENSLSNQQNNSKVKIIYSKNNITSENTTPSNFKNTANNKIIRNNISLSHDDEAPLNFEDHQHDRRSSINHVIQKIKHSFSKHQIQKDISRAQGFPKQVVTYQKSHQLIPDSGGLIQKKGKSFINNVITNLFLDSSQQDEELYELNSKNIMVTDTLKTIILIITSLIVCIISVFLIVAAVTSVGIYGNPDHQFGQNKLGSPRIFSHLFKTLATVYKKILENSANLKKRNGHFIGLESNQDIDDHMNAIFYEKPKIKKISDIDSNNVQQLLEVNKNFKGQYVDNHDSHADFMTDFDFGQDSSNFHEKVAVPTIAPLEVDDQYVAPTSRAFFGDELSQETQKGISKKRLPKLLIVGAKKCGSTALKMFLSHHPKLKSPGEQNFFNKNQNYEKGFDSYLNNFDYTFEDEISFDKTPEYFDKPNVPSRVKEMEDSVLWQENSSKPSLKENIKIVAIVCNPIERALSQYNHIMHIQSGNTNKKSAFSKMNEIGNFPEVINQSLDNVFWNIYDLEGHLAEMTHIRGEIENGQSSDSEEASSKNNIKSNESESDRIQSSLKNSKKYQNLSKKLLKAANLYLDETIKPRINMASPTPDFLISSGLYSLHLKSWYNSFNKDQIMIINGEDLVNQPGEIIEEIEEFLNVEKYITEENFIYDKKQGFYCIITKENPKKFCVGDHSKHGSSKSQKQSKIDQKSVTFENGSSASKVGGDEDKTVSKESMDKIRQKLRDLYMPFNLELEQMLGQEGFTKNWR